MCPPYMPYFGGPKPTYFRKQDDEEKKPTKPARFPTFERSDLKPCPPGFYPPCEDTRDTIEPPPEKKGCQYKLMLPYSQYLP